MEAATWVRRSRLVTTLMVAAMSIGVVGCADEAASPVGLEAGPQLSGLASGGGEAWDLPISTAAKLARDFPEQPCMAPEHRQFDFWVGDWNVTNPAGTHVGTNSVTSELDGCLVFEHWTGAFGGRGFSLNDYDAETGLWNQNWVSQSPVGVYASLRTTGGIVDGVMHLEGVRNATGGFTFLDTWSWTENEDGQVIQSADAVIPEAGLSFPFTGVYTRGDIVPAPPFSGGLCAEGQAGAETRAADFMLGSWEVGADNVLELGQSVIRTDLDDCLFIERFESVGGLSAVVFTYLDLWTGKWYRTWVDSEGERLELSGGFEDGDLVLSGTEETHFGSIEVRITWEDHGTEVHQVWEVSKDGGANWWSTATLVYTPSGAATADAATGVSLSRSADAAGFAGIAGSGAVVGGALGLEVLTRPAATVR